MYNKIYQKWRLNFLFNLSENQLGLENGPETTGNSSGDRQYDSQVDVEREREDGPSTEGDAVIENGEPQSVVEVSGQHSISGDPFLRDKRIYHSVLTGRLFQHLERIGLP